MPCKSLKVYWFCSKKNSPTSVRDTIKFYNLKIQKVSVIVEGKPSQLYSRGMLSFDQYDEICKYFAKGEQRDADVSEVRKQLQLHDLSVREYLVN